MTWATHLRVAVAFLATALLATSVSVVVSTAAHASGSVTVQVRLDDAAGPGVAGADIWIRPASDPTGPPINATWGADSNGDLVVGPLDNGDYIASVMDFGSGYSTASVPFEIIDSHPTVTLVVTKHSWVSGTLTGLSPDYAFGEIWYWVQYLDTDSNWIQTGPLSALPTSGEWSVRWLDAPGTWRVVFSPGPDNPYWLTYSPHIVIGSGDVGSDTTGVVVEVESAAFITGWVRTTGGVGIDGVYVWADNGDEYFYESTDGSGNYSIKVDAHEEYDVGVSAPGFVNKTYPSPVSVDSFETASDINFVMESTDNYRGILLQSVDDSWDDATETHLLHVYKKVTGGYQPFYTASGPGDSRYVTTTKPLRLRVSDGAGNWYRFAYMYHETDHDDDEFDPFTQCYFDIPANALGDYDSLWFVVDFAAGPVCGPEPAVKPPTVPKPKGGGGSGGVVPAAAGPSPSPTPSPTAGPEDDIQPTPQPSVTPPADQEPGDDVAPPTDDEPADGDDGGNSPVIWIVILLGLLAAGVGFGLFMLRGRG